MHVFSEKYPVVDIKITEYEKTPRLTGISDKSRISLDYHKDLCNIKVGENIKIDIWVSDKPEISKNIYLMRGIVNKLEEQRLEASFGGLLMFYEGPRIEEIELEKTIYLSIVKL